MSAAKLDWYPFGGRHQTNDHGWIFKRSPRLINGIYWDVWYGMVEVCEGAPVAVSGWVLTDRHDVRPCAANCLHRGTISVSNIIGGTGTLGIA